MTQPRFFALSGERETVPAGTIIFEAGAPGDYLYIVQAGEVEVLAGGQVINTVGPGGIIGEMALIDHGPRSATARAVTECELTPMDEQRFLFSIQNNPFFALEVLRTLADRLRRKIEV